MSALKLAKGIGRYLEEVLTGTGQGRRGIALGALPGFPQWTEDPAIIARAIEVIDKKMRTAPTAIVQLKFQSRILDLRAAIQTLSGETNGASAASSRAFFIAHAAEYAAKHHIQYGAFRAMGVTPGVLKEAGIRP